MFYLFPMISKNLFKFQKTNNFTKTKRAEKQNTGISQKPHLSPTNAMIQKQLI